MDDAAAGGGEVYGNTMARCGGVRRKNDEGSWLGWWVAQESSATREKLIDAISVHKFLAP